MTNTGGAPRTSAFISHHSSQYEAAKAVKAALARAGIDGWIAPDDIEPGTPFDVAIVEQLERSDVIVLLLSARSDQSRHVKRELMLADESEKPIFPVRLEPIEASGLAYWLKEHQWIDWFDGEGHGIDRLVAAIERRVGTRAAAAPPPPPPPPVAAEPPPKRGSNTRLLIGSGAVVAVGLVAIVGFAGLGGNSMGGNSNGTTNAIEASGMSEAAAGKAEAGTAGESATVIEPGLWSMTREVVDISFPKLSAEIEEQIELSLENDPSPDDCVTEATARKPDVKLFDPRGEGECSLSEFEMSGGRVNGFANCTLPATNGQGKVNFAFRGTYTRTLIEIDNDVTVTQPGGFMKFKTRDRSRWVSRECRPS